MRRAEQEPVIPQKWLTPLRLAVIAGGYGLYRLIEDRYSVVSALLVGSGAVMVAYALVNRYGLRRSDRSGLLQVGQTILGLGLIGVGLYLLLR